MLIERALRGLGLFILAICGIVAISVAFDFILRPPVSVRLAHTSVATLATFVLFYKFVIRPLRHRSSPSQLAAIIEENYDLDDRLLTAVEISKQQSATSGSFLESVVNQAIADCNKLRPQKIFSLSTPIYIFTSALFCISFLSAITFYFPIHSSVFAKRMLGNEISWPSQTKLVFVLENLDNGKNIVSSPSPNHLVLHTSDPGSITIQARTLGKLPESVVLHGLNEAKSMIPIGGGDFSLQLPPLTRNTTLSLSGGDHHTDASSLQILIGDSPTLNNWQVKVVSPAYTKLPDEDSTEQELQVMRGSEISFSFDTSAELSEISATINDGETIELSDKNSASFIAKSSGNLSIRLKNSDGFASYYPQQLSWQVRDDLAPQIDLLYPQRNLNVVSNGILPLAVNVSDDFQIALLQLNDAEQNTLITKPLASLEHRHFFALEVPKQSGSIQIVAIDNQQPHANQSQLQSSTFNLIDASEAEQLLTEEAQALRRRLSNLREKLDLFAQLEKSVSAFEIKRMIDSLETALDQCEWLLTERVFSKLDDNPEEMVLSLQELLVIPIASGDVVDHFASTNASRLNGRSQNLWQLANALLVTLKYPAEDLSQAFKNGSPLKPHFEALRDEVDVILESIISWEDYQSAVNLLRQLLDRQRGLYLRTQESVL
jgi:hypothetical protein